MLRQVAPQNRSAAERRVIARLAERVPTAVETADAECVKAVDSKRL